ncbi:hypothetical protein [Gordonia rhizosphera]|uniref:Uncharacterized protein n=1 Tax=Gordonia rhizosphera NBRC 16068 TaxID=1108045 RepID=K6W5A3_9ACTN|nr:hypothetical protein [Gordonia rhizosphera]GAB88876.1 hypothetical protein GORHZ_046_00260 [Gordonia rhizosphera NBRC 16068]
MSARSTIAGAFRRVPFGIGTVVMILIAAMVATVGVVLAIGTPGEEQNDYSAGRLRGYGDEPAVAWTQSSDTLPGYRADGGVEVADTWRDRWLLAYPSGLGRAFLLVTKATGEPVWDQPVIVGLGDCALNDIGEVGCAVKLGGVPDGFYLVDDSGTPSSPTDLHDTKQVIGVGENYLRIDQAGYGVTMREPSGRDLWSRTFATSAKAVTFPDGVVVIETSDGGRFVIDPATGADRLACQQCALTGFDTGITVQHNDFGHERVATFAVTDGILRTPPVAVSDSLRVVEGPSTLPVLTGTGPGQVQATQGHYEIRDPARPEALWQITDPELSKANTKPCGTAVAFALKDRSRAIFDLAGGERLGGMAPPALDDPDANIDHLSCVGSSGTTLVFADPNQITAFDSTDGTIAWTRSVIGTAESVDGYIVLHEGTSITVLRPN